MSTAMICLTGQAEVPKGAGCYRNRGWRLQPERRYICYRGQVNTEGLVGRTDRPRRGAWRSADSHERDHSASKSQQSADRHCPAEAEDK
jgi:hypothetical protein